MNAPAINATVNATAMRTSPQGIASILHFEAIVLSTYRDSVGVLTIGAGHTAAAGPPDPQPGMKVNLSEAIGIFRRDLQKYESEVMANVTVPLTQNQFDALVSWHFNTGRVSDATLTKKLNQSNFSGAAAEFKRWNKAGGSVLEGLVRRRQREEAIFASADYGTEPITVFERESSAAGTLSRGDIIGMIAADPSTAVVAVPEEDQTTEELLANPASSLLPRYRPRQVEEVSRAVVDRFITLLPEERRSDPVYVVGVRGYYTDTMGKPGENDRNLYDDAIFVVEPNAVHNFNANTDPSKFKRRIAKLKAPQVVRYKPGLHGISRSNPYPAFRQDSPCTVVRDQIGEDTDSSPHYFFINLHRGGNTTTSSAGCQTVPPHQWNEFKTLVDGLLQKYSQQDFYYILVDSKDVPKEDEIVVTNTNMSVVAPDTAKALVGLQDLIAALGETKSAEIMPTVPVNDGGARPNPLAVLLALAKQLEKAKTGNVDTPEKPSLTPVNAALGETVGKMLNGRKTVLGTIVMLATTLAPALTPIIPGLGPVAAALQSAAPIVLPLATALTGWGVLGKVDKWFATRTI